MCYRLVLLALVVVQCANGFHVNSIGAIASRRCLELHVSPRSARDVFADVLKRYVTTSAASVLTAALATTTVATAAAAASEGGEDGQLYFDKANEFSLFIPSGWTNMPRKTPTPTMSEFQSEEVLLVASSFVEGASLSVTKTLPTRLLKDFEVEWWFAPLSSFADMGSPLLVAELLVLQRQGDFSKRQTPSEIKNALFKNNNTILEFELVTPLAEEVNRKSLVKAFFAVNKLEVIWVSALSGVWNGDYADKLAMIRESFVCGGAGSSSNSSTTS